MLELMAAGAKIEVKPFAKGTEDFESAVFWMESGEIWSHNESFGTFSRPELTSEALTEHFTAMIRDGFQLIIHSK